MILLGVALYRICTEGQATHNLSVMSQQEIVEIKVNPERLKGRRGILCGLLVTAAIDTLLCLGLFAGKTNEVNSAVGEDYCTLFVKFSASTLPDPSICHFVIGGSVMVFVIQLVLLIETLLVIFFAFAYTE